MASAEVEDTEAYPMTCGNCLEVEGILRDPRVLPCGHTFCAKCLKDNQENINVIVCRDCRQQTPLAVDELPSAARGKAFCDICENEETPLITASTYCVERNRRYCTKHAQSHNDVIDHHQVLSITEFLQSSYACGVRFCEKHKDQVRSLACIQCKGIRCPRCLKRGKDCLKGGRHDFIHIEEAAEEVRASMEPLKTEADEMFGKISALVEEVTNALSQWDKGTDQGVKLIRLARDEQLAVISEKYVLMEKSFILSRTSTKEKMATYLAEEASVRMDEFRNHLERLSADITGQHPVDLLESKTAIEKKIGQLIDGDFPNLLLTDLKTPEKSGNSNREPEIGLNPADAIIYGDKIGKPKVLSGDEQAALMKVGAQVIRGPDWEYGDQDGTTQSVGTVTRAMSGSGWVQVRWSNNYTDNYSMKGKYGLKLAYPPAGTQPEKIHGMSCLIQTKLHFGYDIGERSLCDDSMLLLMSTHT